MNMIAYAATETAIKKTEKRSPNMVPAIDKTINATAANADIFY